MPDSSSAVTLDVHGTSVETQTLSGAAALIVVLRPMADERLEVSAHVLCPTPLLLDLQQATRDTIERALTSQLQALLPSLDGFEISLN